MSGTERERLLESLTAASMGMDVVAGGLPPPMAFGFVASLSGDEPLLLVLNATADGITEGYALLSRWPHTMAARPSIWW